MIAQLMAAGPVDAAVVELVRAGLDAGSNDNVTCILAEIIEGEFTAHEPMVVGAAANQRQDSDTSRHPPIVDTDDFDGRDPEELRYAPLAPRRFRWLRRVIVALVILAAIGIGLKWAYDWTQRQYFVAEHDGQVVIYKGLDGSIAGFDLSEVFDVPEPPLEVSDLDETWSSQVEDGIEADSLQDAEQTVENLRDTVSEAPEPNQQASQPTQTRSPSGPGDKSRPGQRDRNQGGRS